MRPKLKWRSTERYNCDPTVRHPVRGCCNNFPAANLSGSSWLLCTIIAPSANVGTCALLPRLSSVSRSSERPQLAKLNKMSKAKRLILPQRQAHCPTTKTFSERRTKVNGLTDDRNPTKWYLHFGCQNVKNDQSWSIYNA